MGLCLLLAFLLQAEPASYREALALVEAGRLEEAERALLEALVESPSHAPSSVALARLYARAERLADAERTLEAGLRHHPEGLVLSNELGSLLLRTGRPREAEPVFRRALRVEPANVRALIGLAQSLADAGDVESGMAVIEEALAKTPGAGELHFFLGALRLSDGEHGRALESLSRAAELGVRHPGVDVFRAMALAVLGEGDEAERTLRGVLERHPGAPEARKQLGLLLADREPLESLAHLKEALRALPRDAGALEAAGRVAYALNRDGEALEFLARALAIDPSIAAAWLATGRIHLRRGEPAKARAAFERALPALEARFHLGEIAASELRFEDAVAHFREVGTAEAEIRIGEALSKLGRSEEALRELERALASSHDPLLRAKARYLEAALLLERSDDDAAVASLVEARDLDPNRVETRYLLGTTLARLGRALESREELDAFRKLKAFEEEKERLELRILERPEDGESYVPLIELYLDSGRDREARTFLEKALMLSPGSTRLRELETRTR
jgi:tetratricopeptide (TPR) repeat protein